MNTTRRSVSQGAEKQLNKVYKLHNHGEVELVDYMGNDATIAAAARTSYQRDQGKTPDHDQRLITRLWRDKHTSPFEMVSLTFRIRLPIFVMRQHVRHRTASLNEWSFRYTECPEMFFEPEDIRLQGNDKQNKQMSGGNAGKLVTDMAMIHIKEAHVDAYWKYKQLLKLGVSREQARMVLPVSAYTQIVWNMDMRNLLGYLKLRLAEDAQKEIRDYAKVIRDIVAEGWPMVWEAYCEE